VELFDREGVHLPLMPEPNHLRLKRSVQPHTEPWSAKVEAMDAINFVIPKCSHGRTASLKKAIDHRHQEWLHKPVGFVSYGGSPPGPAPYKC
jgi:NAD(P)H-dependent FMN reductase